MMQSIGLKEYYLHEMDYLERGRADLSRAILDKRLKLERQKNIGLFLLYERDKHEFSGEIARLALYEDDYSMVEILRCVYNCSDQEPLLRRIWQEQSLSESLAAVVSQCLREKKCADFALRRLLHEINSYVLAQAYITVYPAP
ncbi:MAG: hypothetical protein Q4B48_01105 [Syntrophomonadaceae bacterium]|nr:hypothetical protein [Syntrophomonadaceae bacterium]